MAQARLGIWKPPASQAPSRRDLTFHEFASEWLRDREPELRRATRESYRWQLTDHLLPQFAPMPLSTISPREIDAYKAAKLRGGALAPNQINKTLGLLGMILKAARRYGYIDRNPVDDVDRLKGTRPRRLTMDPEQLRSLLDASGSRRALLATLAGAGLRNGEACALDWRDVNLASGTLTVREAKTDAGVRRVDLPLSVREELPSTSSAAPTSAQAIRCSRIAPDDARPSRTSSGGSRRSSSAPTSAWRRSGSNRSAISPRTRFAGSTRGCGTR
jgi:integrase